MKKWVMGIFVLVFGVTLGQWGQENSVSANTLDEIRQQQEETEEELSSLDEDVHTALEEMSEVTDSLNQLEAQIEEKEASIEEAEGEIEEQAEVVEARMEQARSRLQSLQTNEVNQNALLLILEAESISDLLNRALAVVRLTDAGSQQIEVAQEEKALLLAMQEELVEARAQLENNIETASEQREELEEQVTNLRDLISNNEEQLTELQEKEEAEVARIEEEERLAREAEEREAAERAERERQEAEEREAQARAEAEANQEDSNASTSSSNNESNSNNSSSENEEPESQPEPEPEPETNNSGSWMTMQATGYSRAQPSLSNHTATGIDLRQNSRVIAVDPSVIPLGSMVEVEGMGVYVAGDTGGAIRGNIIDIHFSSVDQALSWGRRSVRVRILN